MDERLERLGLDNIDLLLHHTAAYNEEAYQAMERGVKAGKIHSIGLSNFYEDDVDRMMKIATIRPAVLQNETHPYHQSRSVKAHIADDYDIFDFSLTPDDMQRINTLECGHRFASY